MTNEAWAVLVEEDGKVHVVEMTSGSRKIKGLGVFDPLEIISPVAIGEQVGIGQKLLTRMPTRLPELNKGMLRRAQTISSKDAGWFTARLGIGSGDRVLEAGIGAPDCPFISQEHSGGAELISRSSHVQNTQKLALKIYAEHEKVGPSFPIIIT